MSEVLARAKSLRETAKSRTASADRRKGRTGKADYSEPIELLGEAIKLLSGELEAAGGRAGDEAEARVARRELASALVDCYGMLGGAYRRAGDLDRSIEAYDAGQAYEWDANYDVQNSYNITNAIAVRILRDPGSLASLHDQIGKAIELIRKQVNGKRRNQWWAWADLGELRLLAGRFDEAREAYREFRQRGPRAADYESTVAVLEELAKAVAGVDERVAAAITSTTDTLNESKPSV
jgi:tetratricopeptide (TPR) repeat protein